MRFHLAAVVAIVGCGQGGWACADGLIFQLPADGTWARYAVKTEGEEHIRNLKRSIATEGTLTIGSVGKLMRNQQACRWIELKSESGSADVYPRLVLKMLIPEKHLRRGQDPLAHSVQTFFDPKPIDEKIAPSVESFIDDGFNRIQYEIDRFRCDFPKPLYDVKTQPRATVETAAGRFEDCEIIAGTSGYDGPLLDHGRSVYKGTYRIAIHPKSPFGVVSMTMEGTGREIGAEEDEEPEVLHVSYKRTLTLVAWGEKAESALPNKPEKMPRD